ncbi:MAG: DUF4352 domain-containing protein [bacterium]|nr:DUF4352 domain-containing protein [bacterium]
MKRRVVLFTLLTIAIMAGGCDLPEDDVHVIKQTPEVAPQTPSPNSKVVPPQPELTYEPTPEPTIEIKFSLTTEGGHGPHDCYDPDDGYKYIIADLDITNNGYEEFEVNSYNYYLIGNKVKYDRECSWICDKDVRLPAVTLLDGGNVSGYLAFEIPKGASPSVIGYDAVWEEYNIEWIDNVEVTTNMEEIPTNVPTPTLSIKPTPTPSIKPISTPSIDEEPYEETETYYELKTLEYEVSNSYIEDGSYESFSMFSSWVTVYYPIGFVELINTDTDAGQFVVNFTCYIIDYHTVDILRASGATVHTDEESIKNIGQGWSGQVEIYLEAGETGVVEYSMRDRIPTYDDVYWTWDYEVTAPNVQIQKERAVTN